MISLNLKLYTQKINGNAEMFLNKINLTPAGGQGDNEAIADQRPS